MSSDEPAPFIEAMANVLCVCGHELARHDPEDGECDAPSTMPPWGVCPCLCVRSSDPNRTLDEMRLDALLAVTNADGERAVVLRDELEQVGWGMPDRADEKIHGVVFSEHRERPDYWRD